MSIEYNNLNEPLLDVGKDDDHELDKEIEQNIREGFIVKVFGIIACQLIFVFFIVLLGFQSETFHELLLTSNLLYILSVISLIGCLIIIIFNQSLLKKVPTNYIILFIFTFSSGWIIAIYTLNFSPSAVLTTLFLTLCTVIILIIYAHFTKNDFSVIGGSLCSFLNLIILCSLVLIFINIPLLELILIFFGLIIFSIYLLFDVKLVIGTGAIKYKEDDYILAALNIYIDIIYIFVRILGLLNKNN